MSGDSDPGQKFIGCVVSVRLHPKANGQVDHITGTVRSIGREEHTITLDDGLLNGLAVADKYTIRAEDISSLELITTVPAEPLRSDTPEYEEQVHQVVDPAPVTDDLNNLSLGDSNPPRYKTFQDFTSAFQLSTASGEPQASIPILQNLTAGSAVSESKTVPQNGPEIVYTATAYESNYKAKEKRKSAFNAYGPTSTPAGSQSNSSLTQTQNVLMAKLGIANPVPTTTNSATRNAKPEKTPVKNFPSVRAQNGLCGPGPQDKSPRGKGNQQLRRDEAFEMTIDEIKAVEYNFEENLAQFVKLPASKNVQKPVAIAKTPHFKSTDTTLQANRTIESVKLRSMKPLKLFNTDTGIVIPAIDVNVRNRILNMAHDYGLTHNVTLEVFGRAVAQVCLPLLGDPYRLSPERAKDRPTVLVCCGPHWQGGVGICAARILATQGVETTVYAPKEEKGVCEREENLYKCTGNCLTRSLKAMKKRKYDLVILAMDDQRTNKFSFDPSDLPLQGTEVVLVDPPLVQSYTKALTTTPSRMGAGIGLNRVVIVSPLLPLAYRTNPKVKLYLVNMGIPSDIFSVNDVDYVSPFGDKLIIQFFSIQHEDE